MVEQRPVRVGVIGANYGAATHLPAYAALSEFEVVAVATGHIEGARAAADRFGVERAYGDYRDLCRDDDVDLVDVVTRPRLHEPMVLAAVEAGRHVLCEAPLAGTAAEAERMLSATRRAGVRGFVDMQSRFSTGLRELRRRVREGWIGRVENVRASAFYPTFTRPEAVRSSLWCADAANGADSLRVHGLHTLDLIRWMFGEVADTAVRTATLRPAWPGEDGPVPASSADSSAMIGRLADGAVFSLHTSWVARHGGGWTLEAYGDEGVLRASATGHTGHFPVTVTGARHDDPAEARLAPDPDDGVGVGGITDGSPNHALAGLLTAVARDLRTGAADPDVPTFADGVRLLRVAEAGAQES